MDQEPCCRWISKYLGKQLGSAIDTLNKLHERVSGLKIKMVHHVDQGEGLTHAQLVEIYDEINRLFPRRVRKSIDVPL